MRELFLFMVIVLLTTSMICFVGCSRDGLGIMDIPIKDDEMSFDDWFVEDMYIEDIGISISESEPAQVMVTVYGTHSNGCGSVHEVHYERKGNTISIHATKMVSQGSGDFSCTDEVIDIQGQVSIGEFSTFPTGEYKVITNGIEQVFRVEDDEIWVTRNLFIDNFKILISESRPAQVTVNIEGYFWEKCIPFLETHQKQEGDTIYIQITGEIPSSVQCPLSRDISRSYLAPGLTYRDAILSEYQNQVSIGEFAPGEGDFKVNVNGVEKVVCIDFCLLFNGQ